MTRILMKLGRSRIRQGFAFDRVCWLGKAILSVIANSNCRSGTRDKTSEGIRRGKVYVECTDWFVGVG